MNTEALKHEIQKTQEHLAAVKNNIAEWETKLYADLKRLAEMENQRESWLQKGDKAWYYGEEMEPELHTFNGNTHSDLPLLAMGLLFRTKEEAFARRDFMKLLTKNNLWERLQQEVMLRMELEAYAGEKCICPKGLMTNLYTGYTKSAITNKVREALGDRLSYLFQPLTTQSNAE